jgi:hypothetical protein
MIVDGRSDAEVFVDVFVGKVTQMWSAGRSRVVP